MPRFVLTSIVALLFPLLSAAAEPGEKDAAETAATQAELNKKLAADLTNVKFIGSFTVTGKEATAPKEEEYTITSALKLPEPDLWLLKARIKYGETDKVVPIPLEIK